MKDFEEVLASAVLESGFVVPSWDIMARDILGKLGIVQEQQSTELNIIVTESLVSTDCVLREMEYAKTQPQVTKLLVEGLVTRRKDRTMIWDTIQDILQTATVDAAVSNEAGEGGGTLVVKKKKVWEDIRFTDTIRVFDDLEDQHGLARASFSLMEFELKLQQLWENQFFVLMNDNYDDLFVNKGRRTSWTMTRIFHFQLGLEFDNAGSTLEDFIKILKILQESEILERVECFIAGANNNNNSNNSSSLLMDAAAPVDEALLLFPNKLADLLDHPDQHREVVLNLIYVPAQQQNEQTKKYTTALLSRCQEQLKKIANNNNDENETTTSASPAGDDSITIDSPDDDDTTARRGSSSRKLIRRSTNSAPSLDAMLSGGGTDKTNALLLGSRKRHGRQQNHEEVECSRASPAARATSKEAAMSSFSSSTAATKATTTSLVVERNSGGTKRGDGGGGGGVTRSVSPKPRNRRRNNGSTTRRKKNKMRLNFSNSDPSLLDNYEAEEPFSNVDSVRKNSSQPNLAFESGTSRRGGATKSLSPTPSRNNNRRNNGTQNFQWSSRGGGGQGLPVAPSYYFPTTTTTTTMPTLLRRHSSSFDTQRLQQYCNSIGKQIRSAQLLCNNPTHPPLLDDSSKTASTTRAGTANNGDPLWRDSPMNDDSLISVNDEDDVHTSTTNTASYIPSLLA